MDMTSAAFRATMNVINIVPFRKDRDPTRAGSGVFNPHKGAGGKSYKGNGKRERERRMTQDQRRRT